MIYCKHCLRDGIETVVNRQSFDRDSSLYSCPTCFRKVVVSYNFMKTKKKESEILKYMKYDRI